MHHRLYNHNLLIREVRIEQIADARALTSPNEGLEYSMLLVKVKFYVRPLKKETIKLQKKLEIES